MKGHGLGRLVRIALAVGTLAAIGWAGKGAAASGPADTSWPSYNGTVDGQRFSALDQINAENASKLAEVCRLKVDESGSFHTSLVLVAGTLYLTTARDTLAIDPTTCALRWRNVYVPEQDEVFAVNRGVAYANGKLFRGTGDGRLLAIDAATGKTVWQQQAADPAQGEFFSAAPLAWEGLFIIGTAGGDWGIRGRIMAFDQQTGREVWRFHTIPRGKEIGADTWKNAGTARYGGGGSWTTYSMDMATGEVFVPVGNPAPDFIPNHRPGQNLFADSMVVLDARTGDLKWWFQMVGNDGHDLDLGAAPMLYWTSKGDPMVAIGSKDGYVYGVHRETHKQIFRTPVSAIENAGVLPTKEGIHTCPGVLGGVEWNGPAYDKTNQQVVVGSVDWCAILKTGDVDFRPGTVKLGGGWVMDEKNSGWIRALDPDTGKLRWSYHADAPVVAGITPTAGGVVFSGDMAGNFLVLDSKGGQPLVKIPTGGAIAGGVITYAQKGIQYVATTSGNVSRLTFGVSGSPSLIVYALPKDVAAATSTKTAAAPESQFASVASGVPDPRNGKEIYAKNCVACHGASGEGAAGPALKGVAGRLDFEKTVGWIENPSPKMPKLFPAPLDKQAVVDVAAYIRGF